jgi:hypothetical protein
MKRRRHALIPSTLSVPRSTTSSTVPSTWRPQYPARPHLSGLPTCRSTCPSWTRGRPRRSPAHHVRQSIIQGSHSPPWSRCRHRLPRRTMIPTIISSHSWILVAAASRTTAVRVPWGQRYLPIQQWHTYQIIFNTNSRILTPLRRGCQRHSSSSVTVTSSLCQNYRLWTLLAMRTCSRPHRVSVSDHSFLPYRFCCCSLLCRRRWKPLPLVPPMHVAVMAFLSPLYICCTSWPYWIAHCIIYPTPILFACIRLHF